MYELVNTTQDFEDFADKFSNCIIQQFHGASYMNRILAIVSTAFLLSLSTHLTAQLTAPLAPSSSFLEGGKGVSIAPASPATPASAGPFSRFAASAVVSPLGIGAEFTTNINSRLNLRAGGSMFNYATTFSTSGFAANAKLNLASARTSIDIYPFHTGFRVSPGTMFYNQNRVTAADTVAGGSSFTLNGDTFYSANANAVTGATPVNGSALLNLHGTRPAFTITGGWGNPLARRSHWSFPVEVGAGFTGAPALSVKLNGWACYDQAQTQCTNIANPANPIAIQVQSDLNTQVSRWTKDLEPLKTYPIISTGLTYSFGTSRR